MSALSKTKKILQTLRTRRDVTFPGFLGNLNRVVEANRNGDVYVTLFTGEVVTVHNSRVPNLPRLPVMIGYDAGNKNLLQVLYAREVFANPVIKQVTDHDHTWGKSTNVSWIRGEQFLPGLVMPANGTNVHYTGLIYWLDGAFRIVPEQDIDLSAAIPSEGALFVLLEVDDAGSISLLEGTPVASRGVLTYADIPTPSADKKSLKFAVKVYAGQTMVKQGLSFMDSDIVDLRWSGHGDGGGGGTPGVGKGFETAGRLTLASGEPIPSTEQENKTTVYFTPYNGNLRTFISGKTLSFAELSLDMSAWTKSCLHDIYCYDNSNVVAIEGLSWGTETEYNISAATAAASAVITFTAAVGTNPFTVGDKVCVQGITGNMGSDVLHTAWWTVTAIGGSNPNWTVTLGGVSTSGKTYTSGGTIRELKQTRTTNIEFVSGVLVKDGDDSRVYLGTLYIDGNGYCHQATDKMALWNYYNQAEFRLYFDIDSPHSYNSTTYRYYNGNALCFVSFVCGVDNFLINASVAGQWGDVTTGSEFGYAAIGVDGTTDLLFPNAVMSINGRLAVPVFVVGNGAGCRKMTLCEAAVGTITMSNYTLSAIYKA